MTHFHELPIRKPVFGILCQPARLGLELHPGTLPSSATFLCEAIDGLIRRPQVKEPHPGGRTVPAAKNLSDRARDEHSRPPCHNGDADCPALVLRHDLTPRRTRQTVSPAGPQTAIRLLRSTGKDATALFPEIHSSPAGGCRAGIHSGQPALPEPATGTLVPPSHC